MDVANGLKEITHVSAPVASNTLSVNVFTAPGKPMVGERPKPFGEALGFDPITSTLIFGEYDAVLVDAMTTVDEAKALADWVALHNRNLETIYITHAHFDHFYGLSILLDRFPGARAIATPKTVNAMQMSFTPTVERLARRMFPGQVPTKLVAPEPYEHDTFTLEGYELRIIEQGHTDSPDTTSLYVPSIGLIVAGDVVYNQCRMYVVLKKISAIAIKSLALIVVLGTAYQSVATLCTTNAACTSETPRPRAGRIGSRR